LKITNLKQVVDYQLCCGCGLCAYLYPGKIRMADAPAFGRRPQFKEQASSSNSFQLGLDLCPGVSLTHTQESLHRQGIIEFLNEKWGPVLDVWEGYAADPEIRYKGSSGGAMTAISLYCLERENMHGVLHTTADEKRPYLNKTTLSRSRDFLLSASGSRYSPASPCEELQDIEKAPNPCVFIGKPCDVAAVQNVMRHRSELNAKVGLTMACFCAGTPSTNGTLEMLRMMGAGSPEDLIALRYRGHGWPGKTIAKVQTGKDNKQLELTYEQSWGEILQKYRQWRCYICPDHSGEFADISLGDPWYKEIRGEDQGCSLILIRTELGKVIVQRAIKEGYLIAEKSDPSILPASQGFSEARSMLWGRLLALKLNGAPYPSFNGFNLQVLWKNDLSLKEKIKSILGTMKRIYTKKLQKRQQVFPVQ
jgi:coenzyme F420 hydrogenase subunit beta